MDQDRPGMGSVLPFKGVWPTIGADVFIAPNAYVIGQVTVEDGANIWFNCVLRGDDYWIRIGARSNIQDGTIIHVFKDTHPCDIGPDVTIGHGAILHGCRIEQGAMVGIGAIVLDGAVVEQGAIVAAGAVVSPGKVVKAGEMWAGCPAKMIRPVRPEEQAFLRDNVPSYCELGMDYLAMRRSLGAAARPAPHGAPRPGQGDA